MIRRLDRLGGQASTWGLCALLCATALAACDVPDTQAEYNAFLDARAEYLSATGCVVPQGVDLDFSGTYLLAINTTLGGPILFETTIAVREAATGRLFDIEMQPLKTDFLPEPDDDQPRADARAPVGDPLEATDVSFVEGSFTVDFGEVRVDPEADAVAPLELIATLVLDGAVISEDEFCGCLQGDLTVPINLDLEGSTFGAVRTDDVATAEISMACGE